MISRRRSVALCLYATGLALAPWLPGLGAASLRLVVLTVFALCLLAVRRPPGMGAAVAWGTCLAVSTVMAGLLVGEARIAFIDGGALRVAPGTALEIEATVVDFPRRSRGTVRFPVQSLSGRILAQAREPVVELSPGRRLRLGGVVAEPPDWYAGHLRRNGIARILEVEAIEPLGDRPGRSGITGTLDGVRERAESAITAGMGRREAAVALGFVLGRVDSIDPVTHEDFRRAGLAHLLAVSGQNVMLLVMLAWLPLGLFGLPIRARIPIVMALVAVYVPLAGAGPSIQRAGVMGIAGLLALWAGRPHSRLFALLLAAAATLTLNPRATADVGWQLSFAAVAGIYILAPGLRRSGRARLGDGPVATSVVDIAAITVAATVATAPLMAHHFDMLPVGTLTANLLAAPAVAISMWLGMTAAALGQIAAVPTELPNQVNGVLIAYIAEVAAAISRPDHAVADLPFDSPLVTAVASVLAVGLFYGVLALDHRRRSEHVNRSGSADSAPASPAASNSRVAITAIALFVVAAPLVLSFGEVRLSEHRSPPVGLRVTALDIGQGDAILLQPGTDGAILVDTGPPGQGVARKLGRFGVERLDAVLITHADDDHVGALSELVTALPIGRVIHGAPLGLDHEAAALLAGVPTAAVGAGSRIEIGELELEVMWPPAEVTTPLSGPIDPNAMSVVAVARWGDWSALLTGDAEAEAVRLDPGPIDLLKVAHHGSADAGLDALLQRTAPSIAVISAGRDNQYGHPAASTLETLAAHGVEVRRTDLVGDVVIELPSPGRGVPDRGGSQSRRRRRRRVTGGDPAPRNELIAQCAESALVYRGGGPRG